MKMIAGLGNPGPRYKNTRHNLGFMVLDGVAERLGVGLDREKYQGLLAEAVHAGNRMLLVKPLTFMNLSGACIAEAARNKVFDATDLLVVVDDINLPLGKLRFRPGGSAGGHNGLKSVIERLGSDAFHRLRLGVGANKPGDNLVDHVLSRFAPEEWPEVNAMVAEAVDAALCWAADGIQAAMNRYNDPGARPGKGLRSADEQKTHD
jgi:PTH1 family peptidyl-tRNA hydrolase